MFRKVFFYRAIQNFTLLALVSGAVAQADSARLLPGDSLRSPRHRRNIHGGLLDAALARLDGVRDQLLRNGVRLGVGQLENVHALLTQLENTVDDTYGPRPGPGPGPGPLPDPGPYPRPGPYPPYPPHPPHSLNCADEDVSVMRETFTRIKDFAYSSSGLDLNSQGATDYAQRWVREHACFEAAEWIREGEKIHSYAYSSSGMNLNSRDASTYTSNVLPRRCYENVDYVSEGQQFYSFAYSSSGLNMNSRDASDYTRQKMEERYFSCNGTRDRRPYP